ncbi:MAG: TonB-dependent receptor [Pseudorhodoplanes sp.]
MVRRGAFSAIALVWLAVLDAAAFAQDVQLPSITVTASPIHRRNPARPAPAGPVEPTENQAPRPPQANPILYRGTLPIVTDQFATVTVMTRDEIERSTGTTLGEVLQSKPGITTSGFAPGSASRPIIRGLDNYRVGIQENGISSSGVSEIGEDHAVPIDPLSARNVEVIRGPATLRYGSQAIGGIVNAENNRIPTVIPQRGFNAEVFGATNSADKGREGSASLDVGGGNFAFHADAFGRSNTDYKIPSYPYLMPEEPVPAVGRWQPNSSNRSDGGSFGGSYVFDRGFIGVAVSTFDSLYRVPGQEATATNTRIDMHQNKVTSKGEFRPDAFGVEAVRFWAGSTDYRHTELANENGFDGPQQHFLSDQKELRTEIQFQPIDLRFASWTIALGGQGSNVGLDAPGVGNPGLFNPNTTRSLAGYLFNEFRFNPTQRMQIAGRIEQNDVKGSSPDLFVDQTANLFRERKFTPKTGAVGFLQDLPGDLVASATAQYVERAPRAPELLSRGVHEATGTFDVGNPNLQTEVAKSVELGLRRNKGAWRFELTGFYTRFDGFIYRNLTGQTCEDSFSSCAPDADAEFKQAIYSQRDAIFRGAEFQTQYDVAPLWRGTWGVDGRYDLVRATFTDGTNVPRIPPQRLGGGLYYRDDNLFMRVGLLHAFNQNDISDFETSTAGYNLLKAELSYVSKLPGDPTGLTQLKLGISGDNLLNENVRFAQSFKKDEVLQPGRTIKVFANLKF